MKTLSRGSDWASSVLRDDDPEDFKRFVISNATFIRIQFAQLGHSQMLQDLNLRRRVQPSAKRALDAHLRAWTGCRDCPIGQNICVHSQVFFRGDIKCDILFIGKAPGQSEDTWGIPFVGPAGKKLNEIVEAAALEVFPNGLDALHFACTNTVLCFPMDAIGNERDPTKKEVEACRPRLLEFIEICKPKVIITVGAVAEKQTPKINGIDYMTIKHPTWILQQNNEEVLETRRAVLIVQKAIQSLIPF